MRINGRFYLIDRMINNSNKTSRRPGRPRSKAEALDHNALLQQAYTLFAEQGYEGTSLRQIARQAHMSSSLISYWYGNKEGLWRAAIERELNPAHEEQLAELESAIKASATTTVRWQEVLLAMMERIYQRPHLINFMLHAYEEDNERGRFLRQEYLHVLLQKLEKLYLKTCAQQGVTPMASTTFHMCLLGIARFVLSPGMLQDFLPLNVEQPAERQALLRQVINDLFPFN